MKIALLKQLYGPKLNNYVLKISIYETVNTKLFNRLAIANNSRQDHIHPPLSPHEIARKKP